VKQRNLRRGRGHNARIESEPIACSSAEQKDAHYGRREINAKTSWASNEPRLLWCRIRPKVGKIKEKVSLGRDDRSLPKRLAHAEGGSQKRRGRAGLPRNQMTQKTRGKDGTCRKKGARRSRTRGGENKLRSLRDRTNGKTALRLFEGRKGGKTKGTEGSGNGCFVNGFGGLTVFERIRGSNAKTRVRGEGWKGSTS